MEINPVIEDAVVQVVEAYAPYARAEHHRGRRLRRIVNAVAWETGIEFNRIWGRLADLGATRLALDGCRACETPVETDVKHEGQWARSLCADCAASVGGG